MLIIWTAAKTYAIRNTIGNVLKGTYSPHEVVGDTDSIPDLGPGDVILACGTKTVETLIAAGLVPKNRKVSSLRGTPIKLKGGHVLVTYDPGVVAREYERKPDIEWDTRLALRLHDHKTLAPVVGAYSFVESLHNIIIEINNKYEKTGTAVDLSCDLETIGTDEYAEGVRIVSISFTVKEGASELVYFEEGEAPIEPMPWDDALGYWQELWMQIRWLLTTKKVSLRGANWKFDSRWIVHHWNIYCTNFKFDTILVGSLLNENRSNSLKLHSKIYTNMGGYDEVLGDYDKSRMDLVPKPVLLTYAGGDTDVTQQVARSLKEELLKDRELTNFYVNLLHPSAKTFEQVERNGMCVDLDYYKEFEKELEVELSRIYKEMLRVIPNKLVLKYIDYIETALSEGRSPLKPALLKEFLFTKSGLDLSPKLYTEKTKEPSTSIDHLMMFEDVPEAKEFITLLRESGSASKTLSTYVRGFLKHLRSDGKFHASYMLFRGDFGDDDSGTNTGRTSCKDPALQTIPKHSKWTKKLRRAFTAPPGYTILEADYSQGELRIAAVLAREPVMIEAYQGGFDLHAITAAALNGYELEEFLALPDEVMDALRSAGKAGNFGLLYGMQAPGFRDYAYASYGVVMTEQEAVQKRMAFFGRYPRLPEWHKEAIAFAKTNGYIRSPLGRVRHLPLINSSDKMSVSKAERQAINAPVQATLSDMMQLGMANMDAKYGHDIIKMFMMTHDATYLYVPIETADEWAYEVRETLESLPLKDKFGWDSPVKFVVDVKKAVPDKDGVISLANMVKVKF